jgi:diphthine synthase
MFYLIGLGLRPEHLTLEAKSIIEKSDLAFVEAYTSKFSTGSIAELEALAGKPLKKLGRKEVEEGFAQMLAAAKSNNVALLVFGNPLTATTHIQLLIDAKKAGIKYKFVPGISITNMLALTGLDEYRFGRTVTIVSPKENYEPDSFYAQIEKNLKSGLHTLCLLDIEAEENKFMAVADAVKLLLKIEKEKGKAVLQGAKLVGLYGLGSEQQKIVLGSAATLSKSYFNIFPQSLIVAAELNEKEKEALEALHG